MKLIAKNKKASFDYEFVDTDEAGMMLRGWQVKSIKEGNASIKESYAYIKGGEIFVKNMHIPAWQTMGDRGVDHTNFEIKLLMRRETINKWHSKLKQKIARTIVPTKIIEVRGLLKMEVALCKPKRKYDKKAKKKERDQIRDIQRDLKSEKYF